MVAGALKGLVALLCQPVNGSGTATERLGRLAIRLAFRQQAPSLGGVNLAAT
jgi:hypothetical protein